MPISREYQQYLDAELRKEKSISPVNKPIVYSKAGFTDIDCGFGSTDGLGDTNSFCGQSIIPMKNYDIECTLVPP